MTLQFLNTFKGLTVLDVATKTETKISVVAAKNITFSDLFAIKEQPHDIKDIIAYTWESKQFLNGEECQIEIIVENKEKIESEFPNRHTDSKLCERLTT